MFDICDICGTTNRQRLIKKVAGEAWDPARKMSFDKNLVNSLFKVHIRFPWCELREQSKCTNTKHINLFGMFLATWDNNKHEKQCKTNIGKRDARKTTQVQRKHNAAQRNDQQQHIS